MCCGGIFVHYVCVVLCAVLQVLHVLVCVHILSHVFV